MLTAIRVFTIDVSQHVLSPLGVVAVLMPDHLNAHSSALYKTGHQDRPRSRFPPGSRSDVILAAFQIKKLVSSGLTLSQPEDYTAKEQCKPSNRSNLNVFTDLQIF